MIRATVGRGLRQRADELTSLAGRHMPLSGSNLSFSNFETQRARVQAGLVVAGVTVESACVALAQAFDMRPRRRVVEDEAGFYRVTESGFWTSDRVLAEAVAREFDRIDPLAAVDDGIDVSRVEMEELRTKRRRDR